MKKGIIYIIMCLLLIAEAIAISNYYEIKLVKDKETISYKFVEIKLLPDIDLSRFEKPNKYIIEITSFDNEIIKRLFFDFNDERLVESIDEKSGLISSGELKKLDYIEETLILPYYENAKEINIYDNNINKKLTIDVSLYAKNITTKLKTITPKKQLEEQQKPKIVPESKKNYFLYLLILSLLMILIITAYLRKKYTKN